MKIAYFLICFGEKFFPKKKKQNPGHRHPVNQGTKWRQKFDLVEKL